MKPRALVAIVAAIVIALAVYWLARSGSGAKTSSAGPPRASASNATSPAGATAAAATPDARTPAALGAGHSAAERAAMLEAIAKARSHRTASPAGSTHSAGAPASGSSATTLDILDKTGDTSDWEKRTLGTLNSLLGQCYDLGRAEDPALAGTVALRFKLVGEPNVGGLLERVEILADHSSITQQTIRDCITQQLYALELDPPPDGVTVERELQLKFP